MKTIPYKTSTGVQIGLRYNESPKPMPIDDMDMIEIQGWFIQPLEWHRKRKIDRIFYFVSIGTLLIVFMSYWIASK